MGNLGVGMSEAGRKKESIPSSGQDVKKQLKLMSIPTTYSSGQDVKKQLKLMSIPTTYSSGQDVKKQLKLMSIPTINGNKAVYES